MAKPKTYRFEVPVLEGPDTLTFITSDGTEIVVPWIEDVVSFNKMEEMRKSSDNEEELALNLMDSILPEATVKEIRDLPMREILLFIEHWTNGREAAMGES